MAVLALIYWYIDAFLLFLVFIYMARVLRWEKVFLPNIDIMAWVLRWGFFPIYRLYLFRCFPSSEKLFKQAALRRWCGGFNRLCYW